MRTLFTSVRELCYFYSELCNFCTRTLLLVYANSVYLCTRTLYLVANLGAANHYELKHLTQENINLVQTSQVGVVDLVDLVQCNIGGVVDLVDLVQSSIGGGSRLSLLNLFQREVVSKINRNLLFSA